MTAFYTPIPNTVLDELMPHLKDTELRVLLVVLRQTLGWREPTTKHRKPRDWLSHNQLKAKTGRASAAISSAMDRLVKQGLPEVSTREGIVLSSKQARQRARGQLFYRLAAHLMSTLPMQK